MKTSFYFLLSWVVCCLGSTLLSAQPQALNDAEIQQLKEKQPLLFIENLGQVVDVENQLRPDVLFTSQQQGMEIYLFASSIAYQFVKVSKDKDGNQKQVQTHRYTMKLIGANPTPTVIKKDKSEYFENYYLDHCREGITNVGTYRKVVYKDIYPKIDWVVYSTPEKGIKYDFVLHPGANSNDIKISYEGMDQLQLQEDGSLKIITSLGEVTEDAPYSHQYGKKVQSRYILNENTLQFELGHYDNSTQLVIDPNVAWATYFGGTNMEQGGAIAEGENDIFITGKTFSSGLSTNGTSNFAGGDPDGVLAKFRAQDGFRMWSTYFGGFYYDEVYACAADRNDGVYIGGASMNANINTAGLIPGNLVISCPFLAKFDQSNGNLLWSTFFADYHEGRVVDIAIAHKNSTSSDVDHIFITGYTSGQIGGYSGTASFYQGLGTHQTTYGGNGDAFLARFNPDNGQLNLWSHYGGSGTENLGFSFSTGGIHHKTGGITVDENNSVVYITGSTNSPNTNNHIALNGHQNTLAGAADMFLAKFDYGINRLWATYYGGSNGDIANDVTCDRAGNVYIVGETNSSGMAYGTVHQNTLGGNFDALIAKFTPNGGNPSLIHASYYGGSHDDKAFTCDVDEYGNLYVAGTTNSYNQIAYGNALQTNNQYKDLFIAKFRCAGSIDWGTYYGGTNVENNQASITASRINPGDIYLGATTGSSGLGVAANANTHQTTLVAPDELYLMKIKDTQPVLPSITISTNANPICPGSTINFNSNVLNNDPTIPISYQWLLNGQIIHGARGAAYSSSSLNHGDVISCILTSFDCDYIISNELTVASACECNPMVVNTALSLVSCPDHLGTASITSVSGGFPPYSYLWFDGSTGTSVSNLPPGGYNVVVTDNGGCTQAATASVYDVYCGKGSTFSTVAQPGSQLENAQNELTSETFNKQVLESVQLYPNPTSGQFYIQLPTMMDVEIRITDISGKLIQKQQVQAQHLIELNLEQPAGVYMIHMISNQQQKTLKLIKQ